ncbi:nucleoside-diphosphate sugar epimerase/dehydratase [Chelativorans sp. M5D2P16]|uniref:polysaccharide biosynthesis protein n=1 Tax=Chelativorans sp. M5D2P16 TaxID=3095678 RepID=UPI002ACAE43B|nr:nucleoside-diphosphate sugar epimerase/dehydratase [Chelativorans sp. M5D2P16]MDZ5696509.1 nucleoside-diphosphate sugar epimerase/dehydratase [Chelativorans sp. M5D2P16]
MENDLVAKGAHSRNVHKIPLPLPPLAGGPGFYRTIRSRVDSLVKSVIRNRHLFAVDLGLSALALVLAMWLRVGSQALLADTAILGAVSSITVLFVVVCAIAFPVAGLYKRKWEFASILDYIVLVLAVLFASAILTVFLLFDAESDLVPGSVIAIEVVTLVPLLAAVRLSFRQEDLKFRIPAVRTTADHSGAMLPVLLVGAGHEADLYLRALQRDRNCTYWPVGFLGNLSAEIGTMLRGVPVLGTTGDFEAVMEELEARGQRPRHLIFTAPPSSFSGQAAEQLIEKADRMGMAISRLNPVTELRNTRVMKEFELRPIELTDLLERPQAALDVAALQRFIRGRRVLVTGAGGSIGSELTKQVAALGPAHLAVVDNCEFNLYSIDLELSEQFAGVPRSAHLCDVRDQHRINEVFLRHRPELVFHAAALKHVPMVELNPCEGVLTNVCGTRNVADAVRRCGALGMVQISTDKVVNSTSVMGATKRLAELYCQALDLEGLNLPGAPRFMTVRFGNVLGSSGSLVPLFKRQLAHGGPLTVTHPEMKRFFMTIREAVELTLQASAYGLEKELGQGEIFVLDMGEPIRIVDIARRMIRLAGFTPDKDIHIQIIGCRPGEKLFEELFDANEKRVSPPVPRVLGAVPTPVPVPVLKEVFIRLQACAMEGDTDGLFAAMRTVLPGFRAIECEEPAVVPLTEMADAPYRHAANM